jgi:hypothetical protein
VIRRRTRSLTLGGLLAVAAVLTSFAGTALAVGPNAVASFSPVVSVAPSATPCLIGVPQVKGDFDAVPCPTLPPCVILSVEAAPVPIVCVTPSPIPTATPFESFQGETAQPSATPPPTATSGLETGNPGTPSFLLLVSLVLGGLGLASVAARRRATRF